MDGMGAGGWLLAMMVLILVVWGGFLAWQGGLAKRWLEAWGLRGARAFKQPSRLVEPPHAQRGHGAHGAHGGPHGQGHPGHPHGGAGGHRGKRHDRHH